MLVEDVSLDHTCLGCLGDVRDSQGEYSIAVVGFAVFRQEADQALKSDTISSRIITGENISLSDSFALRQTKASNWSQFSRESAAAKW